MDFGQDSSLQQRAQRGEILFGNVDSWLIWNLTGGAVHITDYSNASRTMLFDIDRLCWDDELCKLLNIPTAMLPKPVPSSMIYGTVSHNLRGLEALGGIPISGSAGDQAAALFGQGCFSPGQAKNTYGNRLLYAAEHRQSEHPFSSWTSHLRGLEYWRRNLLRPGGQCL